MAGAESNNASTILDYLNEDCWRVVLDYVPIWDIIRTESTSRRWQDVVLTYLRSVRIVVNNLLDGNIVTSKHRHARQLMLDSYSHLTSFERWTNKLGTSVVSAYCFRNRTLRLIRKNCPNLEDLTFFKFHGAMDEDGSFKYLRRISFYGGSIPVDDCISRLMCNDTLEELEISSTLLVTGQCLINAQWSNLKSLILNRCAVQSRHLLAATCLGQLTTFELHNAEDTDLYEVIHLLLDKMPNLERLCVGGRMRVVRDTFFESVGRLRHIKDLQVNVVTTDEDLEVVTRQCLNLKILQLESCDDVTGRGVAALCRNAGARLTDLSVWGCPLLSDDDVVAIIRSSPKLEILQLHHCYNITSAMLQRAAAARRALGVRSPLHFVGDYPALPDEEYKELEYHEWAALVGGCTKCKEYYYR